MRPLQVRLGYGETFFPIGSHSTIDLYEGYSTLVVLFVVKSHSTKLQRAQLALANDLVDDSMPKVEIYHNFVDL